MKENLNKHGALLKAASLINGGTAQQPSEAKLMIETDGLDRIAVLTKLSRYFAKALPLTKKATGYLKGRGIDHKLHGAGFNSGVTMKLELGKYAEQTRR